MRIRSTRSSRRFHRLSLFAISTILAAIGSPAAPTQAQASSGAILVKTIDTSQWRPPSPDPSGITYWPRKDHLMVVDAEVDEMAIWAGANMFEAERNGTLTRTYNVSGFNNEPAGIDIEIGDNGHFYIANDSKKTIFDINLGPDGEFGTADDSRRPFLTSGFGNGDPEGLTLGGGRLWTVDGTARRVYSTQDGGNGIYEASDPTSWFDVSALNILDPEGIDYDTTTDTLWIVDKKGRSLNEVTTTGSLLRTINLATLAGATNPADVTLAPASDNSGSNNLYIVDRRVDNNADPNENDGKIYELKLATEPTTPPSGNLLLNPGFEDDTNLDGKPDSWTAAAFVSRSIAGSADPVHGDLYSGKHTATTEASYYVEQQIPALTAGASYTFSAWTNVPPTTDAFTFKWQVRWLNSSNKVISTTTVKTYKQATAGWTQISQNVVAPAGTAKAAVRMNVAGLSATVFVDDVVFQTQ